jgi:uncharacterized delta-60 repeat protein
VVAGYALVSATSADIALARYNTDGSLDSGFGNGGKVLTDIRRPGTPGQITGVATVVQDDGKIVVAGDASLSGTGYDFVVARYNGDGSLDVTFNSGGIAAADFGNSTDRVEDLAFQSDGKIVVAGWSNVNNVSDFAIARFHPDGSLDTSFGGDGKVVTDFNGYADRGWAVRIQSVGGVGKVLSGQRHPVRFRGRPLQPRRRHPFRSIHSGRTASARSIRCRSRGPRDLGPRCNPSFPGDETGPRHRGCHTSDGSQARSPHRASRITSPSSSHRSAGAPEPPAAVLDPQRPNDQRVSESWILASIRDPGYARSKFSGACWIKTATLGAHTDAG